MPWTGSLDSKSIEPCNIGWDPEGQVCMVDMRAIRDTGVQLRPPLYDGRMADLEVSCEWRLDVIRSVIPWVGQEDETKTSRR